MKRKIGQPTENSSVDKVVNAPSDLLHQIATTQRLLQENFRALERHTASLSLSVIQINGELGVQSRRIARMSDHLKEIEAEVKALRKATSETR